MQSIWLDTAGAPATYPALDRTLEVDVVIVGGGITGLSAALRLSEAGRSVAVLEAERFGASNTGHSTGNLYATVSGGLAPLRRKWGDAVLRDVVGWRAEAVDWIESVVRTHSIDCDFARRPLVRGIAGTDPSMIPQLEDDFAAAEAAGLAPRWLEQVPQLPFAVQRAYRIEGQAQFNPFAYAQGLARVLAARGVHLHEQTPVQDIDAGDGEARAANGLVRAESIVLATHSPVGFNLVQAEMEPYREYGISAVHGQEPMPEGIFWIRDDGQSIRSHRAGGRDYLVVVGAKHRVGEPEPGKDYPQTLRDYARRRFGSSEFVHEWSAQQFVSADGLPYVGRSAHHNVLIATGFASDGLTWGTVASAVVADLVQGRETPASERLTPRRFTPIKSAKLWASENANVIRHLIGDRLSSADLDRLSDVAPGEGAIVELDGRKHAVSRAEDGGYTILSPVCTHLGCHVAWNGIERSWDCPCHGSRFAPDGSVIDGPAIVPLENLSARPGVTAG